MVQGLRSSLLLSPPVSTIADSLTRHESNSPPVGDYGAMLSAVGELPLKRHFNVAFTPGPCPLSHEYRDAGPSWDSIQGALLQPRLLPRFLSRTPTGASLLDISERALFHLYMATAPCVSTLHTMSFPVPFRCEDAVLQCDPFFLALTYTASYTLLRSLIVTSMAVFLDSLPLKTLFLVCAIRCPQGPTFTAFFTPSWLCIHLRTIHALVQKRYIVLIRTTHQ